MEIIEKGMELYHSYYPIFWAVVIGTFLHSYVVWIRNKKDNDYTNDDYLVILLNDFKIIFNFVKKRIGLKK